MTAALERGDGGVVAGVEGAGTVPVDADHLDALGSRASGTVTLGIRAENIETFRGEDISEQQLRGRVLVVEPLGSHDLLTVQLGGEQIKVATRPDAAMQADQEVGLHFEQEYNSWLDAESERTIGR